MPEHMNDNEKVHRLLQNLLRADESSIQTPPLAAMQDIRQLVALNKPKADSGEDLIALLASFLNMRIKLMHAVIATILIVLCFLYFGRTKHAPDQEINRSAYVSSIASVHHNTLMPSINTCSPRK
jgi:hypothetical protein